MSSFPQAMPPHSPASRSRPSNRGTKATTQQTGCILWIISPPSIDELVQLTTEKFTPVVSCNLPKTAYPLDILSSQQKGHWLYITPVKDLKALSMIWQLPREIAVDQTGISPWEAEVLVDLIEEVYFSELNQNALKPGQVKYHCIAAEDAGKLLKDCKVIPVVLTLFDERDKGDFSAENNKDKSLELRRRHLVRIAEEAKEQGGYLIQEDLAELLMCDIRTIRRDTKNLKDIDIIYRHEANRKI